MITLNLLPQSDKKELKLLNIYLLIKNIIFLSITGILFLTTALLTARIIMQNYFISLVDQNYLNVIMGKFSLQDVKKFNQEIKGLSDIQKDFTPWSHILADITSLVPEGVYLQSLKIKTDKQMSISGIAEKRNN